MQPERATDNRGRASEPGASPSDPARRPGWADSTWIWVGLAVSLPLHLAFVAFLTAIGVGGGIGAGDASDQIGVGVALVAGGDGEQEVEGASGSDGGAASSGPEIAVADVPSEGERVDDLRSPLGPESIVSGALNSSGSGDATGTGSGLPGLLGSGPGAGGSGSGSGATTTFFGVGGRGKRIAYVVDKSGSMGTGGRMRSAMRELERSIGALPDFASVCVALFDSTFTVPDWSDGFMRAKPAVKDRYRQWLQRVGPSGGTDPIHAFRYVLTRGERPDVIFFMSDGEIPPDAAEEILQLNRRGIPAVINCVAFGNEAATATLRRIAAESRGVYAEVGVTK
jgi:hypothetical protein